MALKSVLGGWLDEETGIVHKDATDAWRAAKPSQEPKRLVVVRSDVALSQLLDPPQLHPDSWRNLRQLVKLHGSPAIISAVRHIEKELQAQSLSPKQG